MSRRIRTDTDRQAVVQRVATTAGALCTIGHTVTHLRSAINARISDGLRGTDYDTAGGSGEASSPTERAVGLTTHTPDCPRGEDCHCPDHLSDRASADLEQLDAALRSLDDAEATIAALQRRYPLHIHTGAARPGIDPCPPSWCSDHWEAGYRARAAKNRTRCARCQRHRERHGASIPPAVLQAAEATRTLNAEGKADWEHWSVARAWATIPPLVAESTWGNAHEVPTC